MMEMNDEDLDKCMEDCDGLKRWLCPKCQKPLSRKQTLKTHLKVVHSIQAGQPVKNYKRYLHDPEIPEPRSTKHMRLKLQQKNAECQQLGDQFPTKHDEPNILEDFEKPNAVAFEHVDEIIDVWETETQFDETNMEISEEDTDHSEERSSSDSDERSSSDSDESFANTSASLNTSETTTEAPLYVIPPRQTLYLSSISHEEHVLSVCAYASKNNLSNIGFQQLLDLINIHAPSNSLCEVSVSKLKQKCGFGSEYMTYHEYCSRCGALYPYDKEAKQCQTLNCGTLRYTKDGDTRSEHFFVSGDIKSQLREILEKSGNWSQIESSYKHPVQDEIFDIQDGKEYVKLKESCGFLSADNSENSRVTLTMFTDGIPLFKSSKSSLWPVYLVINELLPNHRNLRKNMIVWGLWQGSGKPRMNTFFFPFVKSFLDLSRNGMKITVQNTDILVKVAVIVVTMDLQARAYVFNTTQHNGEHGCLFCEEPGVVVPSGKGHCRHYPYRPAEEVIHRTVDSVKNDIQLALTTGSRIKGFQGKTVLSHLPVFEFPTGVTIDYMHGVLLGAVKKLMNLWFSRDSYQKPFFIGHKVKDVDKILKSVQPPYLIHRIPRKIETTLCHWKASELRSWLLFYSVPCLEEYLPEQYFQHYCCLVEGIHILLSSRIEKSQLHRADKLLQTFYQLFGDLYGVSSVGLNIHNIGHLVQCVKNWGPLWAYSCFAFESFNGELLKCVHGKGNVCGEIFWSVQREKIMEKEIQKMTTGKVKTFLHQMVTTNRESLELGESHEVGYLCSIIKPVLCTELDSSEYIITYLRQKGFTQQEFLFSTASKISRNGFTFYSKACTRVQKRNSYSVMLDPVYQSVNVLQIGYFVMENISKRVFAIGCGFSHDGNVAGRRTPHIQKLKQINLGTGFHKHIIPIENLSEPIIFIQRGHQSIAAKFPNFFERD